MAGLLAEGTMYLNREIDGVPQGLVKMPGVATFSITNTSDIKEQVSKDKDQYGQITAAIAIPSPSELNIVIANFDRKSLAMGLMGDDIDLTVGAGTSTDESVVAKLGVFIDLAAKNITAESVVVTDDPMTQTYVEGVDYEVNYAIGMIKAVAGGAIAADQGLLVDYSNNAIDGFTVNGSTRPQVQGEVRLDGRNLSTGKDMIITIDRALLVSDGEIDFMSDEFVEIGMTGRMETLLGKAQPYTVESY